MSTHKFFNRICCVVMAVVMVITILMMNGEAFGMIKTDAAAAYQVRLFDTSKVHTIDIVMDDWDAFLETCENESYTVCNLVIDGEAFKGVGIRAKGNTSLSSVSSMNSDRYSFKIEFDQYDAANTYYGLDKLCLNNLIQDNTYMKDYLTYRMMDEFGVTAPLCSYAQVTVNGEDFGLYLAVEAVEDAFLQRNYGSVSGELYKPDSMEMGGGRGNGKDFDFSNWESERESDSLSESSSYEEQTKPDPSQFGGGNMPDMENFDMSQFGGGNVPDMENFDMSQFGGGNMPDMENFDISQFGGGKGGIGSDDVSLIYSDDDPSGYSNIFDNAKTDVTDADKDRLIASLKKLNEQSDLSSAVDIEQVIRYFVVHNFTVNFDSYTGSMIHNYYLYEENGQLSMIPWDYNLAFGGFMSSSDATSLVNYPIDTPVSGGSVESRPMLAWIFSDENYTEQYHALFEEFLAEVDILGIIAETKALISSYVAEDPTAFCSYEEFLTGADTLYEFCSLRIESISGQLSGEIGSTDDTQQQDTLVDAGDLKISEMGSMGNMGGGNMPNMHNRDTMRERSATNREDSEPVSSDVTAVGTMMQSPNRQDSGEMPDGFDPSQMTSGEMPDGFDPSQMMPDDTTSAPQQNEQISTDRGQTNTDETGREWLLLIASIVVLIGGIVFAKYYPHRK